MNSVPNDDRFRFTTAAHAQHRFHSPLSAEKAARLIVLLGLRGTSSVVEIGCGKAHLLALALEQSGARGIGIDINPEFIAAAKRAHVELVGSGRMRVLEQSAQEALRTLAPQDAFFCIGSAHYMGGLSAALTDIRARLKPGGHVLLGEGYWKRAPDDEYLALLGARQDALDTHADNAVRCRELGFDVLYTTQATVDEWDDYEGLYAKAIFDFCHKAPGDPAASQWRRRAASWQDGFLRWGRDTLGFAYYVLRLR